VPADALFVSATAATGGDGTRAAPFQTIAEAIGASSAGDTIAVGVGEYGEALDVPAGVTIIGACAASTVLRSDAERYDRGVVTIVGAGASLKNVRIAESDQAGIWVAGSGRSVDVEDVLVEDVLVAGVNVEQGAALTARRLVVRRPRATALGGFGRGVTIETGSSAEIRGLVVEDAVELGVLGHSPGTVVDLEDVAISGTTPIPGGLPAGFAIVAFDEAAVTATRVVLDRNTTVGAGSQGGDLTIRDAVIRGTRTRPAEGDFGRGAEAQTGGSLTLERVSLEENHDSAIMSIGEGSRVSVTDAIVRRTMPDEAGIHGWGIGVQDGARLDGERIHVEESREAGIVIGDLIPGTLDITDLRVLDTTLGTPSMSTGRAVSVQRGTFTGRRVTIERATGEGIVVAGAEAFLSDLIIRDTVPITDALQPSGRGVLAMVGGEVTVERAEITGTHDVALGSIHGEARIEASDVRIESVRSVECVSAICAPGGHGLFAYYGASITLTSFHIEAPEVCGVHVAEDGSATLSHGVVRGASIGACVQSEAQEISALQDDVFYVDNDTPLDATMLPVPQPLDDL
jgi:hypothetical protein